MWNHPPMNFADWLQSKGGARAVAATCKAGGQPISRSYLANVAAGRRGLSPKAVARLRPQYPDVSDETWMRWLVPSELSAPSKVPEGATSAA